MTEYLFKVSSSSPDELLRFIYSVSNTAPSIKGMAYYDAKAKSLKSKDESVCLFDYDSYHGVLSITHGDTFLVDFYKPD